jgi:hypothetical protein
LTEIHSKGYDTYGIFGKLCGIAKGRPNSKDIEKSKAFVTKYIIDYFFSIGLFLTKKLPTS